MLYDCPVLMGDQEVLGFDLQGKPHKVVIESVPAGVDRQEDDSGPEAHG